LPNEIITLIANVQQELLKMNMRLSEGQVQDIIAGKEPVIFDADVKEIGEAIANEYKENLLSKIQEYGFEFRNATVLTGGGSMLIARYIEESSRVKYADLLDQFANARGYKIGIEQELRR